MRRPQRIYEKVLLVEGPDDQAVVHHFCNRLGIDNRQYFDVVPCEGYEELRATLAREFRAATDTIGVLVDADADPEHRWQSLRAVIADHYTEREPTQPVPERPAPGGIILDSKERWQKRCGVWIMPDNTRGGMLEDFLLALIPDADVLLAHARQTIAGLPEQRFAPAHRTKAEVHTWLAWQAEPGTPLGLALMRDYRDVDGKTRRYLDADHALAQQFHDWLVRLFEIPSASA